LGALLDIVDEEVTQMNAGVKYNPEALFQQAVFNHQTGNIVKAIEIYRKLMKQYPKNYQLLNMLGIAEAQRGNFQESADLLGKSLKINPGIPETHNNRGTAFMELKSFTKALQSYDRAIQLKPDYPVAHNNRGTALQALKRFGEAVESYDRAIHLKSDYQEAHYNRGNALKELKYYDEALRSYDRSIQLMSDHLGSHYNRGIALQELKRLEEALQAYDRAIQLKPDYSEVHNNRGTALQELKHFDEAVQSYDRAIQLKPDYSEAHFNKAIPLKELKRFEEALLSCDRCIRLNPDYPEAHFNRGIALGKLKRSQEALQSFDQAINLNPDHPEAHFYRGAALRDLKRLDEAEQSCHRAIQLKPDNNFWLGHWFYTKLDCCDWNNYDGHKSMIVNGIAGNKTVAPPFLTLLLTDSPEIQIQSAKIWINDIRPSSGFPDRPVKNPRHDKIRIGYFSADFRDHPVLYLIAEMFEMHDRSRFELYGFSFGPETPDQWRIRSKGCFDQFFDVRSKSDQEIIQLARNLQLDISVDLMGFTTDSRPNIFAGRAAPVQVNYLGYPGTMGAEFIDYIVADNTLIPASDQQYFTEKVVYLPGCFQANCRARDVSQKNFTRADLNLPRDGFVFCCFNNNNKFTPAQFDSWLRILKQVEKSVLWLYVGNTWAADNLRMEAAKRGVHAERLVFATRSPVEEYLSWIRQADLFLDTLPFNAGATASDALRVGVPLVTLIGNAIAGRYAASLLKTLDLEELITHSADEYENLAVELATDRDRLRRIREKLQINVQTSPLFDSERFTRNLERAYRLMYERYQDDLPPDHIVVESAS
jgi:predicted O-linked N-acetylglucosamine transferase (SPINDLY family)